MTLLLGTDEAGYGPNLGPLIVGLTAWQLPADCLPEDLPRRVQAFVAGPDLLTNPQRIPLADSKQLYQPSRGLAVLEDAVLAAWSVLGFRPQEVHEVWSRFRGSPDRPIWHAEWKHTLPVCETTTSLREAWGASFGAGLQQCGMELLRIDARVMQPAEFNRLVASHGSKGSVLSEATLELVRDALLQLPAALANEPALIICDKHGGRDRYAAVLQHLFPDSRLQILREGRAESAYFVHVDNRAVEFRFRTQGEEWLPTALASMTAKYLRELAMLAFNAYWQQHQPGIKPTAGYPQDALRFRQEIAGVLKRNAIAEGVFWRCK